MKAMQLMFNFAGDGRTFQNYPQDPIHCPECKGKGREDCNTCDNDGFFVLDGHHYDCQSCDGEGFKECAHCKGQGTIEAYQEELQAKRLVNKIRQRYGKFGSVGVADWWEQ